MARKRDTNLLEYGISEYAYREMLYFCMQYGEKKEELGRIYSVSSVRYDRQKVKGGRSDVVFEKAVKAVMLKEEIDMIETSAREADEFLWERIIDNVCFQVPYEYLDIACGRRQFYNKRKLFFVKLHKYMDERKMLCGSFMKKGHTGDVKTIYNDIMKNEEQPVV